MEKNYTLLSRETVSLKDLSKLERNAISYVRRLIIQDPEGNGKGNFFELLKIIIRYPQNSLCYKVLYDMAKRVGIAQCVFPAPEHEKAVRKASFKFSTVLLATASKHSGLRIAELRRLLEKGKIEGKKVGNVWFVVFCSLEDYLNRKSGN